MQQLTELREQECQEGRMNEEQFKQFMLEQAEYFREQHGDCDGLTPEEISEDSLEFRRRWSITHPEKENTDDKIS